MINSAMASRVWLLVEWVDENNVFPSYGVVNVNTLEYDETDLHPGKVIFMRLKQENPRRAKILRISESKRYVKEHKDILERQDQKVKNVLQLCMRTIKEMKTENSYNGQEQSSSHSPLPHVFVAQNDNSDSDSESEAVQIDRSKTRNFSKSTPKYAPPFKRERQESTSKQIRSSSNANNSRRRSIVSSTPLPSRAKEHLTLVFDQGTQTEESFMPPPAAKIEAMEAVLNNLYTRFQYLVSQANTNSNGSTFMSESEHYDELSYIEQNVGESWIDPNNTEYEQQVNLITAEIAEEAGAEVVGDDNDGEQQVNSSIVTPEEKFNPNPLRVRRMSAQTTNNVETVNDVDLVPIGSGTAKVPARLLKNVIDWNSHSSATRQLLQAIFPRRVLATHSLTGKQSPAFLNRPPKKVLDPQLVDDIVKTVSTKCGVPKNLVRNSITIKCTEEARLYRNRQHCKQARKPLQQNDENIPPSTPSSDESHAVMN